MTYDPASANPLFGNPLKSRADVEKGLRDLFAPLLPYFSEGGARVRLDGVGAHFDRAAADLEGFARPLWGLTPLAAPTSIIGNSTGRALPMAPILITPNIGARSIPPTSAWWNWPPSASQ